MSILYENIRDGRVLNFELARESVTLGVPYDFNSIMHYGGNSASKNGKNTIERVDGGDAITKSAKMSNYDIIELRLMHQVRLCSRVAHSFLFGVTPQQESQEGRGGRGGARE